MIRWLKLRLVDMALLCYEYVPSMTEDTIPPGLVFKARLLQSRSAGFGTVSSRACSKTHLLILTSSPSWSNRHSIQGVCYLAAPTVFVPLSEPMALRFSFCRRVRALVGAFVLAFWFLLEGLGLVVARECCQRCSATFQVRIVLLLFIVFF